MNCYSCLKNINNNYLAPDRNDTWNFPNYGAYSYDNGCMKIEYNLCKNCKNKNKYIIGRYLLSLNSNHNPILASIRELIRMGFKQHTYYPYIFTYVKFHNVRFFAPYSSEVLLGDTIYEVNFTIICKINDQNVICNAICSKNKYPPNLPIIDKYSKFMCGITNICSRIIKNNETYYYYPLQGSARFAYESNDVPLDFCPKPIIHTPDSNSGSYEHPGDRICLYNTYLKPVKIPVSNINFNILKCNYDLDYDDFMKENSHKILGYGPDQYYFLLKNKV